MSESSISGLYAQDSLAGKLTMRQLLDVLKEATPAERQEFSEWWAGLPIPVLEPASYGGKPLSIGSQIEAMFSDVDFLKNGDSW